MVLYNWTMISVALVFWGVSALRGRSLTPLSQTPIGSNYKDWSAELGEPLVFRSELLYRGGELRVLRVREHPLNVEEHPLTAKSTLSK